MRKWFDAEAAVAIGVIVFGAGMLRHFTNNSPETDWLYATLIGTPLLGAIAGILAGPIRAFKTTRLWIWFDRPKVIFGSIGALFVVILIFMGMENQGRSQCPPLADLQALESQRELTDWEFLCSLEASE